MSEKISWDGERPWGRYKILLETPITKVKLIEVYPQSRFSYQTHEFRTEYWTFIEGEGKLTLDDKIIAAIKGLQVSIKPQIKHRIHNDQDKPLFLIEVQLGSYFGEDDIKRIEDDFGRV